jgi:feruloyl-CoA synthase
MPESELKPKVFWDADVQMNRRDDGSMLVWQETALGPYPDRLSEKIEYWAVNAPTRTWMAERGKDGEWDRTSYSQLLTNIRAIGQALLDLGLNADRPLLILSQNSVAHGLMALGAQYVGIPSAAIAPAYSLLSADFSKLHSIGEQITPGAVFVNGLEPYKPAIEAVFADKLPILCVNGQGTGPSWQSMLATKPRGDVGTANAGTGPDTVAKFMFTSGTTGAPKAVIQTQRMLCSNMEMVRDCFAYLADEPPVLVDWAPWNHVASGNKMFNMALYNGGTYYIDAGKPTAALMGDTIRNLREISPNWYFNVPIGCEILMSAMQKDPALKKTFFKNLRVFMYAGAALAKHTWNDIERQSRDVTGREVLLCTGLGSTETAPFALFCTKPQDAPGNVGIPAKGITLKLVPSGDKLEARLKGPSITPGYWRSERLTEESFDDEGFYCLGDALRFADANDVSKGFYFDGRIAENFKLSSGTWVDVGSLRKNLTDALGGLAQDVVITGENRSELCALIVPSYEPIARLLPQEAARSHADMLNHPDLRTRTEAILTDLAASATGSATRIMRTMYLAEPLELDKGEITDKGSINQRAILKHRVDLVNALYDKDPRVMIARKQV